VLKPRRRTERPREGSDAADRADVNPDAAAVCDPENVDEDCDAVADDDDASATDLEAFYVDADGDGVAENAPGSAPPRHSVR
jgi:hypothetical protein